jgi:hypothetical protein
MYDFTTEDRYLIDQRISRGSVEKEKEAQGLFSFLPTIEVLSRAMWNLPACKYFLKRQRVCT